MYFYTLVSQENFFPKFIYRSLQKTLSFTLDLSLQMKRKSFKNIDPIWRLFLKKKTVLILGSLLIFYQSCGYIIPKWTKSPQNILFLNLMITSIQNTSNTSLLEKIQFKKLSRLCNIHNVWFGLILWHIDLYWLFNAKSCLCIY